MVDRDRMIVQFSGNRRARTRNRSYRVETVVRETAQSSLNRMQNTPADKPQPQPQTVYTTRQWRDAVDFS